ncbi:MAG: 4Fe-4S binding protein [Firmicutes bacterium]|nr:4Fe-4S binding protein [Bacillota bacterium]
MVTVDREKCTGCGKCVRDCPLGAIKIVEKKAVADESCVHCGVCLQVCEAGAISKPPEQDESICKCTSCPVQCEIKPGFTGACRRYANEGGVLVRNRPLVTEPLIRQENQEEGLKAIKRPLITAVGAGTSYPCCRPAPHIVQDIVDDVEVVTVVTEAPLSYSGVKVKIDTNFHIGDEGAKVRRQGRIVGMVDTEEYGSKMLSIGGANLLTGQDGFTVARTIVEICNGEKVKLRVEKGARLELQVGEKPVINGQEDVKMRVGCGSATIGIFAPQLAAVVDEAIILDYHVVGLLSEHVAGEYAGMKWSGVIPRARKSTKGRYFGEPGFGWGGTSIEDPRYAILEIDPTVAKPNLKILVTETTGRQAALFSLQENGEIVKIPMPDDVKAVVELIASSCEDARVSAVYVGGTGGSARAGVTNYPFKLTQAVHAGEVNLTIGGAPTYVLPGGGINFLVDVEKVVPKAFTWVPTPATVAPVEYTMHKEKYRKMGGHFENIIDVSSVKKKTFS